MGAKFLVLASAVLSWAVSPALAAEPIGQVTAVQGKVLLNQGDGFVTVEKMATLDVGDQLLVSNEASVSVNYAAADCASTFGSPALVTVSPTAPCANQPKSQRSSPFGGGGGGAVSGSAQRNSTPISIPSLGGGTTSVSPTVSPAAASLP